MSMCAAIAGRKKEPAELRRRDGVVRFAVCGSAARNADSGPKSMSLRPSRGCVRMAMGSDPGVQPGQADRAGADSVRFGEGRKREIRPGSASAQGAVPRPDRRIAGRFRQGFRHCGKSLAQIEVCAVPERHREESGVPGRCAGPGSVCGTGPFRGDPEGEAGILRAGPFKKPERRSGVRVPALCSGSGPTARRNSYDTGSGEHAARRSDSYRLYSGLLVGKNCL